MKPSSFLGLEGQWADAQGSRIVLLPIPLEKTTSYQQGCKNGPSAIIKASEQLEYYDPLLQMQCCRVGIHNDQHMDCRKSLEECLEAIYQRALYWFKKEKFLFSLGGEHSISIGIFKALKETYGPVTILQIDAHADLREQYHGSPLNHACVMARARDYGHKIVCCGIRALSEEEALLISKENDIHCFYDHDRTWKQDLNQVIDTIKGPCYLTIDVDGIDPAEMPATGTPVPGGLKWQELNDLLEILFDKNEVLGADINELKPHKLFKHCDFYCASLAYRIMGLKAKQAKWELTAPKLSDSL